MADAREEALDILKDNKVGVLSTVSHNTPSSRYMTFFNEGFVLYTITDKRTHKVDELEENPHAFVLLGYEEGLLNKKYVEIQGQVDITEDDSLIEHLWSAYMNLIFDGKDDPNIVVLRIKPEKLTLRNTKKKDIIELDLA